MHLSPMVAEAPVRSKVVVLLLLICCLVCFPLVVGILRLSLFCCALLCVLSGFAIILKRKRELLTLIFNESLAWGDVPDERLQASVSPVFEKGAKYDAANYRPVSLTCIC